MSVHLLAGALLALGLAVADVALGRVAPWVDTASAIDVTKATLLLWAMLMPVTAGFGLLLAAATSALHSLPWYARTREVAAHPSHWLAHDPTAFAWLLSVLLVVPLWLVFLWRAAFHFATGYHNPELAAGAMAVTATAAFAVGLVVITALRPALSELGRRLGRLASVASVVVLFGVAVAALATLVWRERRDLFAVIDVRALGLAVGALVVYPLLLALTRRLLTTRVRRVVSSVLVTLLITSAISIAALAYSQSHRVRAVVERETSFGIALLHRYAALSDTDNDGYSFLFGGGDCNDGDPRVHPGAIEIPGDGVDSNCMGGDTDPDVADLGDGHYSAVPNELGRPNILLITIDALRPDRLGAYNPKQQKVSPNIDAFAKDAVRFDAAYAPSSRSIRSIPAMFIGAYPSQLAFGPEHLWPALLPDNVTAVELLAQHGYQTAAAIGTSYFSHMPNFFQGFGQVFESRAYKPQRKESVSHAIDVLDKLKRKQKPWLMWVHQFNVHEPYLHDDTPSKFGTTRIDTYDTEVSLADEEVGRLLTWLKEQGEAERTVVIIASDHGEAFMEHGTIGHSYTLYNEELRSTLLVHVPGAKPRVVTAPVSLIDLAPTLLNLASVPVSRPLPARSLLPLVQGQPPDVRRALYAELMPDGSLPYDEKAVIVDGWKLIWWLREGSIQLFDLRNDPGERRDLADSQRARARELHNLLRAWVTQTHLQQHRRDEILTRNRLRKLPNDLTRRIDADYGSFVSVGYNAPTRELKRGDKLKLDLYFQVRNETRDDYYFEVAFKGPPEFSMPRYLHAAHYPLNGAYRTYEWRAGELLRDPIQVTIPDMATPVTLEMRLRIIRRGPDRITLQAPNTQDGWLSLGQIRIRN